MHLYVGRKAPTSRRCPLTSAHYGHAHINTHRNFLKTLKLKLPNPAKISLAGNKGADLGKVAI